MTSYVSKVPKRHSHTPSAVLSNTTAQHPASHLVAMVTLFNQMAKAVNFPTHFFM